MDLQKVQEEMLVVYSSLVQFESKWRGLLNYFTRNVSKIPVVVGVGAVKVQQQSLVY